MIRVAARKRVAELLERAERLDLRAELWRVVTRS